MLALITLFITGLICLFIAFSKKKFYVEIIATIGLITALCLLFYESKNGLQILPNYNGLSFDITAVMFSSICILFTLLLILSGLKPLTDNKEHMGDHIALLLFSLCGALIMTSFTDFFMFFLGLEILSIPVYVLAGMNKKDPLGSEASLKYFLTGAFSTGILLFGIAWIYGSTGSFSLFEIKTILLSNPTDSGILIVGILLVLASFLFKAGAVPFHFWNPDVYTGSSATIMGFMATVIKIAAFAAILRLFADTLNVVFADWGPLVMWASILSMFVGNLSAIKQTRVRRLLAYSSVAHVGYTLLAVFSMDSVEYFNYHYNVYYYLFAYGLSMVILITAMVVVDDPNDELENWIGLARRNPIMGFFIILALLSLAGVPPLMGFFGKYLVFTQAIYDHPIVVGIALLNSAIAVYYYLKVVVYVLKKPYEAPKFEKKNVSIIQWLVMAICAFLLLLGGFMIMLI